MQGRVVAAGDVGECGQKSDVYGIKKKTGVVKKTAARKTELPYGG